MPRICLLIPMLLFASQAHGSWCDAPTVPLHVTSVGMQRSNEVHWRPVPVNCAVTYRVERSESTSGPFTEVAVGLVDTMFVDAQPLTRPRLYYRVIAETASGLSPASNLTSALYNGLDDEALMDFIQAETFKYFWDFGHPHSGLSREGLNLGHSGNTCASGATGMGVLALIVGSERGFATRTAIADRVLRIVRFLDGVDPDVPTQSSGVQRYRGAWAHWINGQSGATIPFSAFDDGGDLVETALLMQGLLTARRYFDGAGAVETEIRSRITDMWRSVEWDAYERFPASGVLYWHWSPNNGWAINLPVRGFNEAQLVYLLAIASPTHAMPASSYTVGWAGLGSYTNGQTAYGQLLEVGPPEGGPLFLTQYSALGLDPRYQRDAYTNYADHARAVALAQVEYARQNPQGFAGYSVPGWGLTASSNPFGYAAHAIDNDNGTIAPTAALASMPFTPRESLRALRHFYDRYGPSLLGTYGFYDAFNPTQSWTSPGFLGIDQGPIIVMIENHRTQLLWRYFMDNARIQATLYDVGFHYVVDFDEDDDIDASDAFICMDCTSGPVPNATPAACTAPDFADADLNQDGAVDLQDLAILQQLVPGS